ncbi:MAG: hypothetical protein K2K25_13155, partial [Muribaculaceae bacterium]|nr:hypothetical protein [Muribaculaceae bacterium]
MSRTIAAGPSHWLLVSIYRKREVCTDARSTVRGLRIARMSRTSKLAEASRRICYTPILDTHVPSRMDNTYPRKASTVCYIPDESLKVAKFLTVKKERRVNASIMSHSPSRIA